MKDFLSHPLIYNFFQWVVGAKIFRKNIVNRFIKPKSGDFILDIGCGTGSYLKYMQGLNVNYFGFDENIDYINYAQLKYKNNKQYHFFCGLIDLDLSKKLPKFDIILCMGVQHHLDEKNLNVLYKLVKMMLKANGKFVTMDPYLYQKMNVLEWFLNRFDRGEFIRTENEYYHMLKSNFDTVDSNTYVLGSLPARAFVAVSSNISTTNLK